MRLERRRAALVRLIEDSRGVTAICSDRRTAALRQPSLTVLAQDSGKQRAEQSTPTHLSRTLPVSSGKNLADQRVTRCVSSCELDDKHHVRSVDDPRIGIANMLQRHGYVGT